MEVASDQRKDRRVSHMNISIDVLWTLEEETARDAEEIEAAQRKSDANVAKATIRDSAIQKLKALGLTDEEIEALR